MDLDAAADELYGGSPEEFVERRKALMAEARAAKDRELARQIGSLRRPTRTAWLVNVLAREEPEEISQLLDLGSAMADAQRRMAGAELRSLSAQRRTLVDRLARQALQLGASRGYVAPDASLQEVSQTLQASLGDPVIGQQLRAGRLATAASFGGFGPTDLMAAMAASLPTGPGQPQPAAAAKAAAEQEQGEDPDRSEAAVAGEPALEHEPEPDAEGARLAAAQREEAGTRLVQARQGLTDAEADAEQATAHADELADRIEALRSELTAAQADEVTARESARAARRHLQEMRRKVAEAQHAYDGVVRASTEEA